MNWFLKRIILSLMGFLRTLSFLFGAEVTTPGEYVDSGALLREATAKKEAGDINGAIESLEQFWSVEPFSGGQPVEAFLKLPMYLQKAGRRDEGSRALNILLTNFRLPTDKQDRLVLPMIQSTIYDKMRVFWQREGESALAVRYGVLSHLSWIVGLHRQRRREELRNCMAPETVEYIVTPLLKNAGKLHLKPKLCALIQTELEKLPNLEMGLVLVTVDRVLNER